MKKYTARLAQKAEGVKIQQLVDPGGKGYPGVDWDDIFPWWAIVLNGDEVIGCCQVMASKPVGHVEFLNLSENLTQMQRAYAFKVLIRFAVLWLHSNGVFVARSSIPFGMKNWKKVVKTKFNAVHQFDAGIVDMRVH